MQLNNMMMIMTVVSTDGVSMMLSVALVPGCA